jgi:hypothetical protein
MRRAERVTRLDVDWAPNAGAPEPMLWQNEQRAVLIFESRFERTVLAEFEGCVITQFGHPNDEALAGHRLYRLGLREYGVFQVIDSSWLRELNDRNRIAFPSSDLGQLQHFVITFHDSTFECLAKTFKAKDVEETPAALLQPYLRQEF